MTIRCSLMVAGLMVPTAIAYAYAQTGSNVQMPPLMTVISAPQIQVGTIDKAAQANAQADDASASESATTPDALEPSAGDQQEESSIEYTNRMIGGMGLQ